MAKFLPVYLFLGFLEAGKTKMIQESMEDKRFNSGEKTLLITCEEGIEEYNKSKFYGQNVYFENIENESDITSAKLEEISKKHILDRIIIEYNGMWQLKTLYDNLPSNFDLYQVITVVDLTTFDVYNSNMRSLVVDKFSVSEMVVFNRSYKDMDKEKLHKIVKAINPRATVVYDYPDGQIEYDEIEDELPFDVNAPIIEIDDRDYALFYRDIGENTDSYDGKTVKFKGLVAKDDNLKGDSIVIGRHIMTCCAEDITYCGLVCHTENAKSLNTGDWITVTAKIKIEKHPMYPRKGPVLYAENTGFAVAPNPEVATFY